MLTTFFLASRRPFEFACLPLVANNCVRFAVVTKGVVGVGCRCLVIVAVSLVSAFLFVLEGPSTPIGNFIEDTALKGEDNVRDSVVELEFEAGSRTSGKAVGIFTSDL